MPETFLILVAVLAAALAGCWIWRIADDRRARRAWRSLARTAPFRDDPFHEDQVAGLPEPAQRYFGYVLRSGAPLSGVVEIEMRGELGLGSKDAPGYRPMRATQVLAAPRGFVWSVAVGPINGSDGLLDGRSWTRFRAFGLLPVVRAGDAADHARSAFGRVVAEAAFWSPAALLPRAGAEWTAEGPDSARVTLRHGVWSKAWWWRWTASPSACR